MLSSRATLTAPHSHQWRWRPSGYGCWGWKDVTPVPMQGVPYYTGHFRRSALGAGMGEVDWERARLFPVSGIGGADEQERRATSALLAVVQSVREFGRVITLPMGAPGGRLSAFIEVP